MLSCICSVFDHRKQQITVAPSVWYTRLPFSVLFYPHFDVTCDQLLNKHIATWDLFVNFIIMKGSISPNCSRTERVEHTS